VSTSNYDYTLFDFGRFNLPEGKYDALLKGTVEKCIVSS